MNDKYYEVQVSISKTFLIKADCEEEAKQYLDDEICFMDGYVVDDICEVEGEANIENLRASSEVLE